jgi:hypothetical protein
MKSEIAAELQAMVKQIKTMKQKLAELHETGEQRALFATAIRNLSDAEESMRDAINVLTYNDEEVREVFG